MKRANIKILLIGAVAIITAFVPPVISNSQKDTTPKELSLADSLNIEAKAFAKGVESVNSRVDALSPSVYANKSEANEVRGWARKILSTKKAVKKVVVPKPVAVAVPVPVAVVIPDTTKRSKTIIFKASPIYKTAEIKYMNFSEWRISTGEKSERKYRQYLKDLKVIK